MYLLCLNCRHYGRLKGSCRKGEELGEQGGNTKVQREGTGREREDTRMEREEDRQEENLWKVVQRVRRGRKERNVQSNVATYSRFNILRKEGLDENGGGSQSGMDSIKIDKGNGYQRKDEKKNDIKVVDRRPLREADTVKRSGVSGREVGKQNERKEEKKGKENGESFAAQKRMNEQGEKQTVGRINEEEDDCLMEEDEVRNGEVQCAFKSKGRNGCEAMVNQYKPEGKRDTRRRQDVEISIESDETMEGSRAEMREEGAKAQLMYHC